MLIFSKKFEIKECKMDLAIVRQRIRQIEDYENQNKISRETLKNELDNEPTYEESVLKAKEAILEKRKIKDEIFARKENQEVTAQIKENMEEIKMMKEILSAELAELFREKQVDEIEDEDGDTRKFKLVAKVMPKKTSRRELDQDRDTFGKFVPDGGKGQIIAG